MRTNSLLPTRVAWMQLLHTIRWNNTSENTTKQRREQLQQDTRTHIQKTCYHAHAKTQYEDNTVQACKRIADSQWKQEKKAEDFHADNVQ